MPRLALPHYQPTMEFEIRGTSVDIDVLLTLDGRGWTFSYGIFLSADLRRGKARRLPVGGRAELLPNLGGSQNRCSILGRAYD